MTLHIAHEGEWLQPGGSGGDVLLSPEFKNFDYAFARLESIEEPPEWLKNHEITRANSMFTGCVNIREITQENFDFSSVVSADNFVTGCENIETVEIDATSLSPTSAVVSFFQNTSETAHFRILNLTLGTSSTSKRINLYKGPGSYNSPPRGSWRSTDMTNFLTHLPDVSSISGDRIIRFYCPGTQWSRVNDSSARAKGWIVEYQDQNGNLHSNT